MRKRTVFIVMAHVDYEGSDPVRAFLDEKEAEAFSAKCEAHNAKAPPCPDGPLDTPEAIAEHDAWSAKCDRWAARHPAGKVHAACDSYPIWEIPLVSAKAVGK